MNAFQGPAAFWKTPHRQQQVAGTDVLTWDLDAIGVSSPVLLRLLTRTEIQTIERFPCGSLRRRRLVSRALVRTTLAAWTGGQPEGLVLRHGPHGKPFLEGGPSFNASHSDAHFVLAVRPSGQVGVDIEVVRPSSDLMTIARSYFTPEEAEEIAVDPATQAESFFRTWVRKEALLKGIGAGLSVSLGAFRVSSRAVPQGTNVLLESRLPARYGSRWIVVPVSSAPGTQVALALSDEGSRLHGTSVPGLT